MNKELIAKLKDKSRVQVWLLCSKEERAELRRAAKLAKLHCLCNNGAWLMTSEYLSGGHTTYLIDADYAPKPEYEDF